MAKKYISKETFSVLNKEISERGTEERRIAIRDIFKETSNSITIFEDVRFSLSDESANVLAKSAIENTMIDKNDREVIGWIDVIKDKSGAKIAAVIQAQIDPDFLPGGEEDEDEFTEMDYWLDIEIDVLTGEILNVEVTSGT